MESNFNDEINIQDLAIRIIRYFRKYFNFILVLTIIGLVIALFVYLTLPKTFESKLIVMSDILTESYSKEITESLNNLIKEGNSKTLATKLDLSESESELINKINVESVKKDNQDKEIGEIFIVTADIRDKNILPKLQTGIIQFLRNNEFVRVRVDQKKKYFVSMIDKIESEIKSLDSLKKKLFIGQPIYSKTSEMMLVDPTNIYSKIVELTKQQWEYKNDLELVDSIQLIEGFTSFEKPASPKLSVLLAIGFFGGFFMAIFILTLKHLFKLANSQAS
jgi:uncharacterized protein involved in exopolysaccharide biosynthesis